MRQYDEVFDKLISNGLRPYDHIPDDGMFLTYASNCYPSSKVLISADQWEETFPQIQKQLQIFTPVIGVFIITDSEVYSWNGADLSLLLSNIPAGEAWSMADFSPVLIFTNGVAKVTRNGDGVWSVESTDFLACCKMRGRLLASVGNRLHWTRIGELKFQDKDDLLVMQENSAGSRAMDWPGTIYAIHPHGKGAIVYGSGGITVIEPLHLTITDYQMRQSINTFKFDNLDYIGVPGTLAAIRINDADHRYVSNDGHLYRLSAEGKKRLGYKEYIPAIPRMCYNSHDTHELLIIGGATPSLAINDFGAGGLSLDASAVAYDDRVGLMVHTADGALIDQTIVEWWSDMLYFDRAGDKTIEQVILHAHDIIVGTAQVSIGVKMTSEEDWTFSEWFTFNEALEAACGVTGLLFMIKVSIIRQNAPDFHYLQLGIKYTDRRFVRGATGAIRNANKTSSGTDS
jgi:hypothetical protein